MPESNTPKPVVLIVRDGWGENPNPEHDEFNAVKLANTPVADKLMAEYPNTLIHTSSRHVGLPEETMGNSEVGHQNLGAGRIVNQESVRITVAIEDGSFYDNKVLVEAAQQAKANGKKVHLLGICSDAGVHGRLEHLYACVELCKKQGLAKQDVCLHLFMDGRDTGPFTGQQYLAEVEAKLTEIGVGQIVSLVGRYYAMDRDNRWERVEQAYKLLTTADSGATSFNSADAAIQNYYDNPTNDSQEGDEFVTPRIIGDGVSSRISDGDTVLFYNYRGDRPREISRAFIFPDDEWANVKPSPDSGKQGFDRGEKLNIQYVMMTAYEEVLLDYAACAFVKPPKMENIGGAYLAAQGKRQFRCAETEKFPHVTFFFNDYRDEPFEGETREMAQSPSVATYDLQPEMSAAKITELVLEQINPKDGSDPVDFILVNYANGDMVGHTGKLDAAIKACETVDACVGQLVDATLAQGGKLIVTADHGNSEQMFDPNTGKPHTAHTLYDVPCIIVDPNLPKDTKFITDGKLADIYPTILKLMHLDPPNEMTAQPLY